MSEITGVGFYESLNKFFVGFLILVLFVGLNSDLFINPLFLISAYIVGCIYQAIIQVFTKSCLSLQEDEIKNARIEVCENEKESCKKHISVFMKDLRCALCCISKLFKSHTEGNESSEGNEPSEGNELSKDKEAYLKAYYKIAKAGLLMNIPVLEALENFMRNLMFILPIYIIFFVEYEILILFKFTSFPKIEALQDIDCICIVLLIIFLILVLLGVIWLRYYYQQTIYRLVWEGDKYLDEINNKDNQEEDQN